MVALATLALLVVLPGTAAGSAPTVDADSILQGQLLVSGSPADSGTVSLHGVGAEGAAALDSVQVDAQGRFNILLPGEGSSGEGDRPWEELGLGASPTLFILARWEGVPYFGDPFPVQALPDEAVTLEVFPSRSVPPGGIMLPVEGRELTIRPGEDGWAVLDRFRIRNDSTVTWVAGQDSPIVWQFPLPAGARDARYVDGDPTPEAVDLEGTGVQLVSPLRPGPTVLSLSYQLPDLDTRIPLPGITEAMGVRVDPAAPSLSVQGLQGPVTEEVEGRSDRLHAWYGGDLSNQFLHMAPVRDPGPARWVAVFLGLILLAISVLTLGKQRRNQPGNDEEPSGNI